MLHEMLALLDDGVAYSQDDLARLTGTSRETVEAGIAYLAHAGYLKPVAVQSGCGGSCKGCPGCGASGAGMPPCWERTGG